MIGDRPNTDIACGKAANVSTCLVMTGVVKGEEDFKQNWASQNIKEYIPDYTIQSLGDTP